MSFAEQIYLTAAITAFIFFGTTLFSLYVWTGMAPKPAARPSRTPLAVLAVTLVLSLGCATLIAQAARDAASAPPPQITAKR